MLLSSILSLAAAAHAGKLVLHEITAKVPSGFISHGPPDDAHLITLRFGLASNNIAGLHEKLLSISTPGSADFRKWMTQDEVKTFVSPSSEAVDAFNAFASVNSMKTSVISPHGDWISATLPISQANTLFGAKYTNFTHPDLAKPLLRTLSVSLPAELAAHVQVIHPSTAFTVPRIKAPDTVPRSSTPPEYLKRKAAIPAGCDTSTNGGRITPACLQAIYDIPTTPATQQNNVLMVTGYGPRALGNQADLELFLRTYRPDLPSNTTFKQIVLGNETDPDTANTEANLDLQYAAGIASGVPLQFLTVSDDEDLGTELLDTTIFLATTPNPPTVVTTSYGIEEPFFGESLATKICEGYSAATARGISLLFSSGDNGVNGRHDQVDGPDCGVFFVGHFPASCPWGTSVGATKGFNPEVGIRWTGGGFSDYFPALPYQSTAVSNFLQTIPADFRVTFNRTNRAYPDISLQGAVFDIILDNSTTGVSGTSASTPVAAAMISLINDQRLAEGKPALGFLNPFLYANPNVFNDITIGSNPGMRCPDSSPSFTAVPGWDPVGGLGSPRFPNLLAAALSG
ncbi:family S53 protease-like protein [Favolaschia claudopus]|uniref:tripeptidyl-peptidase II n=1 Tax=Favolaschia claudopus TaxID=2862362 RepID=A0AAV9Z001_9AGAR